MEEDAKDSNDQGVGLACRGYYAEVAASSGLTACPVCGGPLAPHANLDLNDFPARTMDRRGILLPRRHAVGGIITPR